MSFRGFGGPPRQAREPRQPEGNGFDLRQVASAIFAPLVGGITGAAGGAFGSALQLPQYLRQGGATTATGAQNQRGRGQLLQNAGSFLPYAARNIAQGANRGYQDLTAEVTNPNYDATAQIDKFFQALFGGRR